MFQTKDPIIQLQMTIRLILEKNASHKSVSASDVH